MAEVVRAMRRLELPAQCMEQADVVALCPPSCSVWNNWRGGKWQSHLSGHRREGFSWSEHGRDGAGFMLAAAMWRLYLEDRELPEEECPITGLLDAW